MICLVYSLLPFDVECLSMLVSVIVESVYLRLYLLFLLLFLVGRRRRRHRCRCCWCCCCCEKQVQKRETCNLNYGYSVSGMPLYCLFGQFDQKKDAVYRYAYRWKKKRIANETMRAFWCMCSTVVPIDEANIKFCNLECCFDLVTYSFWIYICLLFHHLVLRNQRSSENGGTKSNQSMWMACKCTNTYSAHCTEWNNLVVLSLL